MAVTPEQVADILRTYVQTRRSPHKTARSVGCDVADVFAVVDANTAQLAAAKERHGGEGRPELRDFVVARRRANERAWDNNDPAISTARKDYENGTHEMATGRDGPWLILYSIPRKKREYNRDGYFLPELSS